MKPEESFVGQPIRSLQTMLRTIAQTEPLKPLPEPDGVYTNQTAQAVADFQRRRGMTPTGVADQNTWDRIVRAFEPARIETEKAQPIQVTLNPGQVISPGQEHHILYLAQAMLITMAELLPGFPAPEVTGVLDPETERALLAFQLYAGLRPTGRLDKQTWKALALQYAVAGDELSRRIEDEYWDRNE